MAYCGDTGHLMGAAQAVIPVSCSTYPETEMSRTFPALKTALIAVGLLFATSSLAALSAPPVAHAGAPTNASTTLALLTWWDGHHWDHTRHRAPWWQRDHHYRHHQHEQDWRRWEHAPPAAPAPRAAARAPAGRPAGGQAQPPLVASPAPRRQA